MEGGKDDIAGPKVAGVLCGEEPVRRVVWPVREFCLYEVQLMGCMDNCNKTVHLRQLS